MQHQKIAVVDFGGQYAHLIAAKVRRKGVLAEIRQPEDPIAAFDGFAGIIKIAIIIIINPGFYIKIKTWVIIVIHKKDSGLTGNYFKGFF